MIRPTCRSLSAATASAIARYVLPVPAGPIPNVTVQFADRVDVALLRDRLRRDLLAAMRPDEILEDLADVRRLVDCAEDRVDGACADLLPALDELDELLDDRLRLRDLHVVAGQREPVSAQIDGAAEPLPQGVEYPVADACELGGDVVRNVENRLHKPSVGSFAPPKDDAEDSFQKSRSWLQPEPQLPFPASDRSTHDFSHASPRSPHRRCSRPRLVRRGECGRSLNAGNPRGAGTRPRREGRGGAGSASASKRRSSATTARRSSSSRSRRASRANTHRLHLARANFHAAQLRIMARLYSLYVGGKPTHARRPRRCAEPLAGDRRRRGGADRGPAGRGNSAARRSSFEQSSRRASTT